MIILWTVIDFQISFGTFRRTEFTSEFQFEKNFTIILHLINEISSINTELNSAKRMFLTFSYYFEYMFHNTNSSSLKPGSMNFH